MAGLSQVLLPNLANAHGWVEYPSARQNTCYMDGGFWVEAIPNQACQAAFDVSGAFPFVQRSEISANVSKYEDIENVKAVVKDGSLCSAGANSKVGLDVTSPHWQKTSLQLNENNEFELVFYAKTPHDPSYWEVYLSNASYTGDAPLTWADLDMLVKSDKVVLGEDRRYRLTVKIPEGRTGDAILYTRWQRKDPGGEGFYNCSDISLSGGGASPEPASVDPTPSTKNLTELGYFVSSDFEPVDVGDTVRLRTFSPDGQEVSDIQLPITANNQSNWMGLIATQFNDQNKGQWFIGIWHTDMNHYMYDSSNVLANKVHATNSELSYQLSLIKATDPTPPEADTWSATKLYKGGDVVTHDGKTWTAKWETKGQIPGTTGKWGVWRSI
uniref:lytic polysaccharide monooxygenase n=1 Tax=Vibrio sp. S9_S30 TaxID=2720226 RepID=UPI001EED9662|nr:lytic polysaccharide monooxygenase [Vibrio sp. S9_S30]